MAIFYPDILQHNNPTKPLINITEIQGTAYPLGNLSETGSIPSDKRQIGQIIYVSGSSMYYSYYGQTTSSGDWNNSANWKTFATLSGSFTGSFSGSFTGNVTGTTATASYILPLRQNVEITGSINMTGSLQVTGSIRTSGSRNLNLFDGDTWLKSVVARGTSAAASAYPNDIPFVRFSMRNDVSPNYGFLQAYSVVPNGSASAGFTYLKIEGKPIIFSGTHGGDSAYFDRSGSFVMTGNKSAGWLGSWPDPFIDSPTKLWISGSNKDPLKVDVSGAFNIFYLYNNGNVNLGYNPNATISVTGSLNAPTITGSLFGLASSASYVTELNQDVIISGDITASNALFTGTITAQRLNVQYITSSVIYVTGSTKFGTELTDTHQFTGSLYITGSIYSSSTISASAFSAAGITGSIQFNNNGFISGSDNFIWDSINNRLGIGTTTPSGKLGIVHNLTDTTDNIFVAESFSTATSAGNFNTAGISSWVYGKVNSGVTNSGSIRSYYSETFRNTIGLGDNGTLNFIFGARMLYGHYNTDSTATPTTNNIYGLFLYPFARTGTISNLYNLYIADALPGGAITNHWGIFQISSTAKNYLNGSTGIGTQTISAKFQVHGIGATSSTFTAQFHNSTGTSNSLVIRDDGNIGVGTSSPVSVLQIRNPLIPTGLVDVIRKSNAFFQHYNTPDYGLAIGVTSLVPFLQGVFTGTSPTGISLQPYGGSVGVGTELPTGKLHVVTDASLVAGMILEDSRAWNNTPYVNIQFRGLTNSALGRTIWSTIGGGKESAVESETSGYLSISTRPQGGSLTERVRVSSTGNVGIGLLSNISAKLHVAGTVMISSSLYINQASSSLNSGSINLFTYSTGSYTSTFYNYIITSGSNSRAGQLMTVWNGSEIRYTDTSTTDIGDTSLISFTASLSSSNVIISSTFPTAGWSVKTLINLL